MGAPNFYFGALESPVKSRDYENQEKLEKRMTFFQISFFFIKIAKFLWLMPKTRWIMVLDNRISIIWADFTKRPF